MPPEPILEARVLHDELDAEIKRYTSSRRDSSDACMFGTVIFRAAELPSFGKRSGGCGISRIQPKVEAYKEESKREVHISRTHMGHAEVHNCKRKLGEGNIDSEAIG
ncbi:unnamed protein product [Ectocarpus sp. 4 AP-2014]